MTVTRFDRRRITAGDRQLERAILNNKGGYGELAARHRELGIEQGKAIGRREALEDAAKLVERRGAGLHARAVDVPRTAAAIRAMIEGEG